MFAGERFRPYLHRQSDISSARVLKRSWIFCSNLQMCKPSFAAPGSSFSSMLPPVACTKNVMTSSHTNHDVMVRALSLQTDFFGSQKYTMRPATMYTNAFTHSGERRTNRFEPMEYACVRGSFAPRSLIVKPAVSHAVAMMITQQKFLRYIRAWAR
jgi:hypothetical protein